MKALKWIAWCGIGALLAGCQSDPPRDPSISSQEIANANLLASAPLPVRTAFGREFPASDVVVTSVGPSPVASGPVLYRVAFVRNGSADERFYREDGASYTPVGTRGPVAPAAGAPPLPPPTR